MPNVVNQMAVRELTAALDGAEGLILISMAGLTVEESEELRNTLAAQGVQLRMVRNKLARRAFADNGIEVPEGVLAGNVAIAFGESEVAIHTAKVVNESPLKKAGKVAFRGGMMQGATLDENEVGALADIPDQDTLRAQILGAISGPARGLVQVVNAVPSAVARVLAAHADEEGGAE